MLPEHGYRKTAILPSSGTEKCYPIILEISVIISYAAHLKRRRVWQACVKKNGMRKQKLCPTKNGALEWEATQRKILKKNPGCETSIICLLDWANQYLKYAEAKFTDSVFREKKVIFKRFFRSVSSTLLVEELDMGRTIGYFQVQKNKRSGNASNKDRKYLHAAWEWGVKYIQGFPKYSVNPFKTDKMPETRHPRYVPPEKDLWAVLEQAQGQEDRKSVV